MLELPLRAGGGKLCGPNGMRALASVFTAASSARAAQALPRSKLPQQARSILRQAREREGLYSCPCATAPRPHFAAMSLPEGYSAKKTKINEDKLADWLREQVTGDLEQVPGIGPANVKLLAATDRVPDKVETTYQLIGKFLSLKAAGTTCVEHCDMFYYWLQAKGVNAGRNNIVLAIAEKCEVFLPGCYDAAAYED